MNKKASKLLKDLGDHIIKSVEATDKKWVDCSVRVQQFEKGVLEYSHTYRNQEDPDKKTHFDIIENDMSFYSNMGDFSENTKSKSNKYWKVCMFKIDKKTKEVKVDFEFDDEHRWEKDIFE